MKVQRSERIAVWLALVLWGGLFTFVGMGGVPADRATPGDTLSRVFGSLRVVIARQALLEADRVFHRGVGHQHETFFDDVLQRWRRQLSPTLHEHLPDRELVELLPWMRWTVRANPQDVEAWLVAVYWLSNGLGRLDLALAAAREAAAANPGDYRPYLQWARLLLRVGRWDAAARLCDRALELWPAPLNPDDELARLDEARLWEWRGYLWSLTGESERALAAFERVLARRPNHETVRLEMERIRSGAQIAGEIGPGLSRLLRFDEPLRHLCDTCEAHEGHPGHHLSPTEHSDGSDHDD